MLKSGAKSVGKELLRSGIGFLGDVTLGATHPKQAADARFKEFTGSLKRKADEKLDRVLNGGGIKKRRLQRVTPQSLAKLLSARTSTKKRSRTVKKRSNNNKKTKQQRNKSVVQRKKKQQQKKKRKTSVRRKSRKRAKVAERDIFA